MEWEMLGVTLGILVTWSAVLLKAFDWMLKRLLEELDGKMRRLETRLETVESQYVKREDWMRLTTTFEARFDLLMTRLDTLRFGGPRAN